MCTQHCWFWRYSKPYKAKNEPLRGRSSTAVYQSVKANELGSSYIQTLLQAPYYNPEMGYSLEWIWDPVAWSSIPFTAHYSCCMQCSEQSDASNWNSLTNGKILDNNNLLKIFFFFFKFYSHYSSSNRTQNISLTILQLPINQSAGVFPCILPEK